MSSFNNITVIGAGNMGSAIAQGLLKYTTLNITLANRSEQRLQEAVRSILSDVSEEAGCRLSVSTDFPRAVAGAGIVVIAVKPWAVSEVMRSVSTVIDSEAIVISVAAGIGLDELRGLVCNDSVGLMYMIPNTALQVGRGMSFAASRGVDEQRLDKIKELFAPFTRLEYIDESKMGAATALCSCGIAYVYKFIAAAAQAGVELGFTYDDAVDYFTSTVAGATKMIETTGSSLQQLVNGVTTPGGMTIRGVNELDRRGFTGAVIDSILCPLKR